MARREAVTTLPDLVTRSQKLSPKTKELYLTAVERFVSFAGNLPGGWSALTVEAFRDHLVAVDGMKPRSANTYLHGVRYVGRRWAALGLGPNFASGAEYARVEGKARQKAQRQALVEADLDRLLEATSGDRPVDLRDRAIVVLGIRAGGRRAVEMAGLNWDDVDARGHATFHCKGGYDITVPLDDEAQHQLAPWHAWLATMHLPSLPSSPVFRQLREGIDGLWHVGGKLSRQSVWQIIRNRGEQAGLKRALHPHILRHTFVQMAEAAGMTPQDIMRMTGHRSLQTLSSYISKERFTERSLVQLPPFTGRTR